jgi:lysophospholipid acyltransferase (LPLAT)-like uncharacterized protein
MVDCEKKESWGRSIAKKVETAFISWCLQKVLKLIVKTCKITVYEERPFKELSTKGNCILTLWHNRLLLVKYFLDKHRGDNHFAGMVSASRDGQMLAKMMETTGYARPIYVKQGEKHQALLEMIAALQRGEVLMITPDGPRGPRYRVKPGVLFAAAESEAEIIPFSWSANRFWQVGSWDKMIVPKPFSHVHFYVGEPFRVGAVSRDGWKEAGKMVEERLRMTDRAAASGITVDESLWPD